MKKYLLVIAMGLVSTLAQAHNGNNGWVTVKGFDLWSNTYTDPQIRIIVSGDAYYNPAGSACTGVDSYMVSTALPDKQQDRIYSTLLSAVMANKAVQLRLDTNLCENNRPRIINVMVQ